MKTLLLLCSAALIASTVAAFAADGGVRQGQLRHVVAFKFKDGATKEQIQEIVVAFRDLKKKIPQIAAFEWGTNVSPEKHDKGFTHQFIVTFKSDKDRDAYLVHAAHKEFGQKLGPILADVFVIDFWTQ